MVGRFFGRPIAYVALAAAVAFAPWHAMAADAPLQIPVVLPLTGLASFLGKQEQVAMQLGEKMLNKDGGIQGRPVQFSFSDDQSNPQVAVQLVKQIAGGKPPAILGSSLVASCNAMTPLLKNGPVGYCFSPGIHPDAGSFMFTSTVSTHDVITALIRYFRLKGWTRVAMITSTDATGQDAERGIDEAMKGPDNSALTMVSRAHFNPTDVSVAAQLESIKGANPQAIIAWTTGTPLATVFKGMVQAQLDVPVAISYSNMTYAQMSEYADFLPKHLLVPSGVWPPHSADLGLDPSVEKAQHAFYATFDAEGMKPDVAATLAWDPMMIVVSALRKLGPDARPEQIHDYIEHLKAYAGINGLYDFEKYPQRGLGPENAVVTQWSPTAKAWEIISKPTGIPLTP